MGVSNFARIYDKRLAKRVTTVVITRWYFRNVLPEFRTVALPISAAIPTELVTVMFRFIG